jgi:bacterioferritin (cytochrome b1)
MRIIEADSRRHREIQQVIVDSLAEQAIALTPEGMADVWDQVEAHVEMERKMVDGVRESLDAVTGEQLVVQEYLLRYLLADERKHERLLSELDSIKRGMHPYGA